MEAQRPTEKTRVDIEKCRKCRKWHQCLHEQFPDAPPCSGFEEPELQASIPEVPAQKQEVPAEAAAEKPVAVSAPLKNILARINKLTEDDLALINKFGLPIKDFAEWMFMMEQTLRNVGNITEEGIADKLFKKAQAERPQQQQTAGASSGNQGGGMGNIGSILQLLTQSGILGAGGGSNVIQEKIMDMSLESLGLGNALMKAMINRIAPEIATQLITTSMPKGAKT